MNENEIKAGATNDVIEDVSGTDTGAGQVTPPAVTESSESLGSEGSEKPKQDSATNAKFARERREAERAKALQEQELNFYKTEICKNPWTGEPIETQYDVEMYKRMKQISQEGKDPIADYPTYLRRENLEIQQKNSESVKIGKFSELSESAQQERMTKDLQEFGDNFPNVDAEELLNNKSFLGFAEKFIGDVSLSMLYEMYQNADGIIRQRQNEIERKATQLATGQAAVGALGTPGASAESDFFTKEQVEKMSNEEISKNYDKIRRSQARW